MKKSSLSTHSDESALIRNLINGNASAFEYVVAEYHTIMLSVARAIVGETMADDVVQDVWIAAIGGLTKFQQRASLKTWLLQIVSNTAKSRLKREQRYTSLDENWQAAGDVDFDRRGHRIEALLPWDEDTPEALLANEQLHQQLVTQFQQLPALQRATLTIVDIEGMKLDDVCNILDVTPSNARVLLHRARVAIHNCIAHYRDNL